MTQASAPAAEAGPDCREVDFGPGEHVLRLADDGLSVRVSRRSMAVTVTVAGLAVATGVFALTVGDYAVSIPEVLAALTGRLDGPARTVVLDWRAPRVLLAILLGGSLAVSGAIFQSLTRNPLGSPDIIGFSSGAYTGALVAIIMLGGGYAAVAGGAMAGGLVTAVLVYVLAYRSGVQGFRLIIVGIAVSAMLNSANTWLILEADLQVAMIAAVWGAGSLNAVGWAQVWPTVLVLAVVLPLVGALARKANLLEMGDDAAHALGVRPEPTRAALMVVGVALTALATAVAGPIAFVALAAPQIARRLTKSAGVGMASAAAMGALLMVVCDVIAQRAFAPTRLPVGIVTVSIGGAYLVWLLTREARRQ